MSWCYFQCKKIVLLVLLDIRAIDIQNQYEYVFISESDEFPDGLCHFHRGLPVSRRLSGRLQPRLRPFRGLVGAQPPSRGQWQPRGVFFKMLHFMICNRCWSSCLLGWTIDTFKARGAWLIWLLPLKRILFKEDLWIGVNKLPRKDLWWHCKIFCQNVEWLSVVQSSHVRLKPLVRR